MFKRLAGFLLLSTILVGCQTSMLKQFEKIKPGLEKDDVLLLMGSPTQSQRFHGKDRWYYVFYDQRIRFEKEVQFTDGNATYIGDTWEPPAEKSAVAVDKENETNNLALDSLIAKQVKEAQSAFDEYEKKVKSKSEVRYIPEFEPVR